MSKTIETNDYASLIEGLKTGNIRQVDPMHQICEFALNGWRNFSPRQVGTAAKMLALRDPLGSTDLPEWLRMAELPRRVREVVEEAGNDYAEVYGPACDELLAKLEGMVEALRAEVGDELLAELMDGDDENELLAELVDHEDGEDEAAIFLGRV